MAFWCLCTQTIQKPDKNFQFLNGLGPQIPKCHLKTGQKCPVFRCHLNIGPFANRTTFDYLDGYCSWSSDSHCIYILPLNIDTYFTGFYHHVEKQCKKGQVMEIQGTMAASSLPQGEGNYVLGQFYNRLETSLNQTCLLYISSSALGAGHSKCG